MWDVHCQSRHIERPEVFEKFKLENNIVSSNLGFSSSLLSLKDTLLLGKIRSPQDWYFKKRYWNETDIQLPWDIVDHGCYYKTKDNQVLFTAHSYKPIEKVKQFFSDDWCEKNSLVVNVLDGSLSWHSESACLIVIMIKKDSPSIML